MLAVATVWGEYCEAKILRELDDLGIMKITIRDDYAFKHWLLGFWSKARIISPDRLVTWFSNEAKALNKLYSAE